ncbi:hypothetical protein B7463_g3883, partial [Scytalidium lignicola]
MALNKKYSALPDLTGTARSNSSASSYKDFDEEDDSPGISRSRLHPDAARSHFSPARVDATDIDFSDRVTAKRKSYKVSTRKQRVREDGTEEYGDFSDEEDGESLERKVARLKREMEEVKEEYNKRKSEKRSQSGEQDGVVDQDIVVLTSMLDGISGAQNTSATAAAKLAQDVASSLKASEPAKPSAASTGPATYTVTYAPDFNQNHALAKAADFDDRLTFLEKVLGLSSGSAAGLEVDGVPKAILPTLDILHRQLSVISESTPSSLDSISRRVRTLTQEAEKLEEARKKAKAAQDSIKAASGDVSPEESSGDSEQTAKINALYGTLPTIEKLSPLLPSLLDRLRSLRAIHTDAATASESLGRAEKRQADMATEIKKWREGLEKVEEAMKQGETVMGGNMKVVEGWVKELEEQMARL